MYLKSLSELPNVRKLPVYFIPPKVRSVKSKNDLQFAGEAIVDLDSNTTYSISKFRKNFLTVQDLINMLERVRLNDVILFKKFSPIYIWSANNRSEFYLIGILPELPAVRLVDGLVVRPGAEIITAYSGRFTPAIYQSFFVFSSSKEEKGIIWTDIPIYKEGLFRTTKIRIDKLMNTFSNEFKSLIENAFANVSKMREGTSYLSRRTLSVNLWKQVTGEYK